MAKLYGKLARRSRNMTAIVTQCDCYHEKLRKAYAYSCMTVNKNVARAGSMVPYHTIPYHIITQYSSYHTYVPYHLEYSLLLCTTHERVKGFSETKAWLEHVSQQNENPARPVTSGKKFESKSVLMGSILFLLTISNKLKREQHNYPKLPIPKF